MRRTLAVAVLLVFVLSVQMAYASGSAPPGPPGGDYDLFLNRTELQPGVTSDIHVKVFVNDQHPGVGRTVFAISGLAHTAQSWDQYAEALFTHPFKGVRTWRVVAIDLPGHGQSAPPTNAYFGYLSLDDYVTAITATLDGLRRRGIYPQEIIGHSQGGLLIQMLQERLVSGGSSLLRKYGISRAVLLAPAPAAPIDWHVTTNGTADGLLACWLVDPDPVLGPHLDFCVNFWWGVFFANFDGVISPDAPTPDEIEARGYRAPAPLVATMQLLNNEPPGLPFLPRPAVSPTIFGLGTGTLLHVVSYVDDTMIFPSESQQLFSYLVDNPCLSRNTVVETENGIHDRVHELHITNPSVIIRAMSEGRWFDW